MIAPHYLKEYLVALDHAQFAAGALLDRFGALLEIAHLGVTGMADVERKKPLAEDTIFRIYSMTKPITSVAFMMLVEEGRLSISDPVSRYIPAFARTTVLGTVNGRVAVVPASRATAPRRSATSWLIRS